MKLAILAALAALPSVDAMKESNADFGESTFGYDFGADGQLANTPNNMQRALAEKAATRQREMILNPNKGSLAKIQRYVLGLFSTITLATPAPLTQMTGKPRTKFRPQRITTNALFPGFASFSSMQVSNVGILVGGTIDAYDFTPGGGSQCMDVPTLGSQDEISIDGDYSGLVNAVAPHVTGSFDLVASFKGPSSIAGG